MNSKNKIALLLFVLLTMGFIASPATAGGTEYVGDLNLRTQADVDAFNYTSVTGSLYIWDLDNVDPNDDIVDLTPVSSVLESVGEALWINDTHSLAKVEGFANLTSLGWGLYFYTNSSLVSVSGFNNLLAIGDNLEFYDNAVLTTVTGFKQLQSVANSLEIYVNPLLTVIPMFDSLTTVTNSQIFIFDNASLPRITGFNNLDEIGFSFVVQSNPQLSDLCGFYTYATNHNPFDGGGSLVISDNGPGFPSPAVIQDIVNAGPCDCYTLTVSHTGPGTDPAVLPANSVACPAGQYVAGELIDLTAAPDSGWYVNEWTGTDDDNSVSNANQLIMPATNSAVSVTYGAGPVCAGDVNLTTQAEVDAFDCAVVTGWLSIIDADNVDPGDDIVDLGPVSSVLESVGGTLWIEATHSLTMVEGFDNLTSLGGGLYFYTNESLVSISGFNNLLASGDSIEFYDNASLTSITGFKNLETSGWSFEISYNPVLTTIPMFNALTTIQSSLFIYNNDVLPRITAFNALNYVDYSFVVTDNTQLADLCGFYNYASAHNPYDGGGSLVISGNGAGFPSPAVMQDIVNAGPCDCYTLSTTHTGSGSDPAALPGSSLACGEGDYVAGELIDLIAVADSGWGVEGWSGTVDDASTSDTNQLIMPAANTAVSVTYGQELVCYPLTYSHSGSGADPFRYPSKSIGCDDNHYVAGEVIGLLSSPAEGWNVVGWIGTDNDGSTAKSNQLTMPASARAVSVLYGTPAEPDLIYSSGFEK